jgi:hypothetical protein
MSMSDDKLRAEIEERFLGIADDDKLVRECASTVFMLVQLRQTRNA